MEILRGGGANKCKFGEHQNIRKQIFSFLGTSLSLFGGWGGGQGNRYPHPTGGLHIVNYWKSTNNLCI